MGEVDAILWVVDAAQAVGPGDRTVAGNIKECSCPVVVAVTKTDRASPTQIAERLMECAAEVDGKAFVPVSGATGDGVSDLQRVLLDLMEPGPEFFPEGMISDQPEAALIAELLREQLLVRTHDELPHSIAVVVSELEERTTASGEDLLAAFVTVFVERDSQKGIVVGRGGALLKEAATNARLQLEGILQTRLHLDVRVKVERDWQRRSGMLDRLGF